MASAFSAPSATRGAGAAAFGFSTVTLAEYLVAIGLGVLVIPIVEIVKLIQRKLVK